MGRKIPGKKHKGFKDPLAQQAKREERLKPNAPPQLPNEQEVPKSLIHLMKLKQAANKPRKRKKKNKTTLINTATLQSKEVKLYGMTKPERPAVEFIQRPNESKYTFMNRISRACEAVLKDVQFERKFNVQVNRDINTGEVTSVTKQSKDILDTHKKVGRKAKKKNGSQTLTKKERFKMKQLLKKKKKKEEQYDDFGHLKDEVKFGEVAHAPPILKNPVKSKSKAPEGTLGSRDLLLKSLIDPQKGSKVNKAKSKSLDLTAKRKNLPVSERRQLEIERSKAVKTYRMLKEKKLLDSKKRQTC